MYPPLGRPREFKFKMREELVNHVARGASVEQAAQIVGVSVRTVQREAKHNQQFHHDLELAKHSAPSNLEDQMKQAARTHWRAAAWLLERQDPERFGKRPANSCSPAMLQDACDFLIERALEATPEEHREAVYRHLTLAADQMYEVIMPDRSVERRCLASGLAQQTTPLCCEIESELRKSPDYVRQQQDKELAQRPWRQVERLLGVKPPQWRPAHGKRLDSSDLDAAWRYPTEDEVEAYYDKLDEKRGLAPERVAERERNRELLLAALDRHQREKQKKNAATAKGAPASAKAADAQSGDVATPVPPPVCNHEPSDGVIQENCEGGEGLMSPKTCFRDKSPATKCDAEPEATPGDEPPTNLPPDFDIEKRVRERRAEILDRMNQERRQAG